MLVCSGQPDLSGVNFERRNEACGAFFSLPLLTGLVYSGPQARIQSRQSDKLNRRCPPNAFARLRTRRVVSSSLL